MLGQQKVLLRPLVTKKVVNIEGEQNQEYVETRERSCFIFEARFHQLPEEPLLKWIMRMTNLRAIALGLNAKG